MYAIIKTFDEDFYLNKRTSEKKVEKSTIKVSELSEGDRFRYRGSEYTVVAMEGSIYPDDIVISKNETIGGSTFAVTANVDKFRLVREGEYLGNPNKVIAENETPQLSAEDIAILRQLEPRKSVLNFTDEEMKLTEKWQERFAEIGEKSPYYRLQNGDWRESEQSRVRIIKVDDHNRDFKGVRDDKKTAQSIVGNLPMPTRDGISKSADTGWRIRLSTVLHKKI